MFWWSLVGWGVTWAGRYGGRVGPGPGWVVLLTRLGACSGAGWARWPGPETGRDGWLTSGAGRGEME
jgi:hypothetical protein